MAKRVSRGHVVAAGLGILTALVLAALLGPRPAARPVARDALDESEARSTWSPPSPPEPAPDRTGAEAAEPAVPGHPARPTTVAAPEPVPDASDAANRANSVAAARPYGTPGTIAGRVRYPEGKPRRVKATLALEGSSLEEGSGQRSARGETDADGTFRVPGLAPGRWVVRALVENPGDSAEVVVVLERGGAATVDVTLSLAPWGVLLEGILGDVERPEGAVVSTVQVVYGGGGPTILRREVATVDARGHFEARLPAGHHRVQVHAPRAPGASPRPWPLSDRDYLLEARRAKGGPTTFHATEVLLSGRVEGAREEDGTRAWLVSQDPGLGEPWPSPVTQEGEFAFTVSTDAIERVFLAADAPLARDVPSWDTQRIRGEPAWRVRRANLREERFAIRGLLPEERASAEARVGAGVIAHGAASLAAVEEISALAPPGPLELRVSVGWEADETRWVASRWIESGDRVRSIDLPKGRGDLEVQVDGISDEGEAPPSRAVILEARENMSRAIMIHATGRRDRYRNALLRGLPAGRYRVSVEGWGGVEANVAAGQLARIRVRGGGRP